jgi:hypothetical protein
MAGSIVSPPGLKGPKTRVRESPQEFRKNLAVIAGGILLSDGSSDVHATFGCPVLTLTGFFLLRFTGTTGSREMFTINMKRPPFRAGLGCALTLGFALSAVSAREAGNTVPGKDDQKAFHALKSGAEAGDARAGYLLATLYSTGRGVDQDAYSAFHWCKLAAEEEVLEAQFQLGVFGPNRQFSALREAMGPRVAPITRNQKLASLCGAQSASASPTRSPIWS